jgi:hypothetical protein
VGTNGSPFVLTFQHMGITFAAGILNLPRSSPAPSPTAYRDATFWRTLSARSPARPFRAAYGLLVFYVGTLFVIMSIYPWNLVGTNGSPFVLTFQHMGITFHQHRHPRRTATRRFGEHFRRAPLLGHSVQHTANAEYVAVNRTSCRKTSSW